MAEAELLADSAVVGEDGTAKNARRRRKARQTKEQPDPILESLRLSVEANARTKPDSDPGEPPEDTHRAAMNEPPSSSPEMDALLRQLQEHAAEVERLNVKVGRLNVLLTSKDQPQTEKHVTTKMQKKTP